MNLKLPKPSASINPAEQCREMGIKVGDTIEGRETHEAEWHDARLTLLWLGDEIAVWRVSERWHDRLNWVDSGEDADWTLECREWHRV